MMFSVCYCLEVITHDYKEIESKDREFLDYCIENLLLKDPFTYSSELKGSIYRKFNIKEYVILFRILNLDKALLILAIKHINFIDLKKESLFSFLNRNVDRTNQILN